MPRRVLVTGAAGFAGSHLLDLLVADGVHAAGAIGPPTSVTPTHIIAWSRPGGHAPRALLGVTWREVDLLDRTSVRDALADAHPDLVYHCGGAAHVGQSWRSTAPTYRINVLGTHHLMDGLRRLQIAARVVVTGSASVYAPSTTAMDERHPLMPSSPYALSKLAQEMVALDEGPALEVVVARSFNHFGPRQEPAFVASGFARRIADIETGRWAPEISVGNLDAQRDLTDVRDTVRAYRLMAERGRSGQVYNICSGQAISIRTLLERLLARAIVPIAVRTDAARYRPNDQPVVLGNGNRIRTELGWKPRISLEQSLDDLLAYWRTRTE
jgi:GDP-4-dehydro-6-deoxy-D-mannose reductase